MKAYVLDGVNELNYADVELRSLEPGEALVEVHAAGICGSDIPRIFKNGTYHFPTIPGHEFSGQVIAVADEQDANWVGKRVGVFPLIPCKECSPCQKKHYEMCQNYNYLGSRCDGGFAEQVIVPVWNLVELSDAISYQEAAMFEPAAVALHAVRQLNLSALNDDTYVLLLGLGTIGGLIAQWLSIKGIQRLIAIGHHEEQNQLMKWNANLAYEYVDDNAFVLVENKYEIVVDCVGSSESLKKSLMAVKPGGQILVVGNPPTDISLEKDIYWKLLRKQVHLIGTWNSSYTHDQEDDWQTVADNVESGKLKLKPLITHNFAFGELDKGLEIMREKTEFYNKIMISR